MAVIEQFANQPSTIVIGGGTDAPAPGTVETWTVTSSASFPAASTGVTQFHIADALAAKSSEIILVTNVSGITWTVTRGAEGTTPVSHTSGFTVYQVVTAGWLGSAVTKNGATMSGYLAPAVTALTPASTVTIDASLGNTFTLNMNRDVTLAFANPVAGEIVKLWVIGNGHVLTWPAGVLFGTFGQPSLSGVSWDLIGIEYSPVLAKWCVVGFAPGFVVPPIAWAAGASAQNNGAAGSLTITVPNGTAIGDLVLIGAGVWNSNQTGLSVTMSSGGTTQPVQLGTTLTGGNGTASSLWAFIAAAGDPGATITITGAGFSGNYTLSAAIGSWASTSVPVTGDWNSSASSITSGTYTAPTVTTPSSACWCVEFCILPVNAFLTTTVPVDLTARTANTNQAIVSDSAASVGNIGTVIGGDLYSSNSSPFWHVWTIALRPQ